MKQFYSGSLITVLKKTLYFFIVFFGTSYVSNAQIYYGSLSGANEFPANTSPGTGKFIVTIDAAANTMRVEATFSGLVTQTTAGAPAAQQLHTFMLPPLFPCH
jgi:hypothetical protein